MSDLVSRLKKAAQEQRSLSKQAFVPAPQQPPQGGPPQPPAPQGGAPQPGAPPQGGQDIIMQMAQAIANDPAVTQMLMQAPDQFMAQVPQVTPDMVAQLQQTVQSMVGGAQPSGIPQQAVPPPAGPPAAPAGPPAAAPATAPATATPPMDPGAMQAIQESFSQLTTQLTSVSGYVEQMGQRLAASEDRAHKAELENARNKATLEHMARQLALIQRELQKPPTPEELAMQQGGVMPPGLPVQ